MFSLGSAQLQNSPSLTHLRHTVDSLKRVDSICRVSVSGSSSIDGPESLNADLALKRAAALKEWLNYNTGIPASIIKTYSEGENWPLFLKLVNKDRNVPMRGDVISIAESAAGAELREAKLRALGEGAPWRYLVGRIFPKMRNAVVTIELINGGFLSDTVSDSVPVETTVFLTENKCEVSEKSEWSEKSEASEKSDEPELSEANDFLPIDPELAIDPEGIVRKLYFKTNTLGWFAAMVNGAVEVDICKHLSFSIPVYWSGWNYFKRDTKMRVLSFTPELRVWPRSNNSGFFANAHFGTAWYNVAFAGDHRWQDHKRHTPAMGGGMGIGYRYGFCRNSHWSMEATLGAGVYKLDYDIFQNKSKGLITGRRKRTFYGIDQAAISFNYSFGLKGKGGKQ